MVVVLTCNTLRNSQNQTKSR